MTSICDLHTHLDSFYDILTRKNSKMPIYEVTAFVPLDVDGAWLVSDFQGKIFTILGSEDLRVVFEVFQVGVDENPSLEYMKSHMNDLIVTKCFSRATMHSVK